MAKSEEKDKALPKVDGDVKIKNNVLLNKRRLKKGNIAKGFTTKTRPSGPTAGLKSFQKQTTDLQVMTVSGIADNKPMGTGVTLPTITEQPASQTELKLGNAPDMGRLNLPSLNKRSSPLAAPMRGVKKGAGPPGLGNLEIAVQHMKVPAGRRFGAKPGWDASSKPSSPTPPPPPVEVEAAKVQEESPHDMALRQVLLCHTVGITIEIVKNEDLEGQELASTPNDQEAVDGEERTAPARVAQPIFHCKRCLYCWEHYGQVPKNCKEPEDPVKGPPIPLTQMATRFLKYAWKTHLADQQTEKASGDGSPSSGSDSVQSTLMMDTLGSERSKAPRGDTRSPSRSPRPRRKKTYKYDTSDDSQGSDSSSGTPISTPRRHGHDRRRIYHAEEEDSDRSPPAGMSRSQWQKQKQYVKKDGERYRRSRTSSSSKDSVAGSQSLHSGSTRDRRKTYSYSSDYSSDDRFSDHDWKSHTSDMSSFSSRYGRHRSRSTDTAHGSSRTRSTEGGTDRDRGRSYRRRRDSYDGSLDSIQSFSSHTSNESDVAAMYRSKREGRSVRREKKRSRQRRESQEHLRELRRRSESRGFLPEDEEEEEGYNRHRRRSNDADAGGSRDMDLSREKGGKDKRRNREGRMEEYRNRDRERRDRDGGGRDGGVGRGEGRERRERDGRDGDRREERGKGKREGERGGDVEYEEGRKGERKGDGRRTEKEEEEYREQRRERKREKRRREEEEAGEGGRREGDRRRKRREGEDREREGDMRRKEKSGKGRRRDSSARGPDGTKRRDQEGDGQEDYRPGTVCDDDDQRAMYDHIFYDMSDESDSDREVFFLPGRANTEQTDSKDYNTFVDQLAEKFETKMAEKKKADRQESGRVTQSAEGKRRDSQSASQTGPSSAQGKARRGSVLQRVGTSTIRGSVFEAASAMQDTNSLMVQDSQVGPGSKAKTRRNIVKKQRKEVTREDRARNSREMDDDAGIKVERSQGKDNDESSDLLNTESRDFQSTMSMRRRSTVTHQVNVNYRSQEASVLRMQTGSVVQAKVPSALPPSMASRPPSSDPGSRLSALPPPQSPTPTKPPKKKTPPIPKPSSAKPPAKGMGKTMTAITGPPPETRRKEQEEMEEMRRRAEEARALKEMQEEEERRQREKMEQEKHVTINDIVSQMEGGSMIIEPPPSPGSPELIEIPSQPRFSLPEGELSILSFSPAFSFSLFALAPGYKDRKQQVKQGKQAVKVDHKVPERKRPPPQQQPGATPQQRRSSAVSRMAEKVQQICLTPTPNYVKKYIKNQHLPPLPVVVESLTAVEEMDEEEEEESEVRLVGDGSGDSVVGRRRRQQQQQQGQRRSSQGGSLQMSSQNSLGMDFQQFTVSAGSIHEKGLPKSEHKSYRSVESKYFLSGPVESVVIQVKNYEI